MLEFVIPGIRHPLFSEFKKKRTEKLQKSTNEKKNAVRENLLKKNLVENQQKTFKNM